ncbi:MAG: polyhydroxyalkanoate synthesis regulator DNA-binding domain-containing protein [Proteobacteria bacterium]|nr:polyhydroxyalkanoate synthesis regulator DNA-binding domain-containing protein [Pseudomonadota bacterium]MBQ9244428.1 polyhydroxyalkanoate synthesis regulator DNA-binding domain-containing protein [Pseudomonadota bacterium]
MDQKTNEVITIKRYSNRKLYDTSTSRYITLTELGELVRCGKNIVVIDNETKADLTDMTLAQVLIAQKKQKQSGIRNLVTTQAETLLQRLSVPVQQIRDEAFRQLEKQFEKFKPKGDLRETSETEEKPSFSLLTKLDSLRASSDEKLLSLLLVQRIEQLEDEVDDLKRRLKLLEDKDDDLL